MLKIRTAIGVYLEALAAASRFSAEGRHDWRSAQRTHSPIFEMSISHSLSKLGLRYILSEQRISEILAEITTFSETIEDNDQKICCERLVIWALEEALDQAHGYNFDFYQILCLVWEALNDVAHHVAHDYAHPHQRFLLELYGIQHAYEGAANTESCIAGTINGLLSGLAGIHKDVNVILIDGERVSSELPQRLMKSLFEKFCLKIHESRFYDQFKREIETDTWESTEIQSWHDDCLEATITTLTQEYVLQIRPTVASEVEVLKSKAWIKRWMNETKLALLEDKRALHDFYIQHREEVEMEVACLSEPQPKYDLCKQDYPELTKPIMFILCVDSYFDDYLLRNSALIRIREWVQENFDPKAHPKHASILKEIFTINALERVLRKQVKQLFKANVITRRTSSEILKEIDAYYSAIVYSSGNSLGVNFEEVKHKFTALKNETFKKLKYDLSSKANNFFACWFLLQNEEDTDEDLKILYREFSDKKFLSYVVRVVKNFLCDSQYNGSAITEITPDQINCVFLYAILRAPYRWKNEFSYLIEETLKLVETSEDAIMRQLKQDSYPQALRDQIQYNIAWRQWSKSSKLEEPPARPKNMLLLPHHARTSGEWVDAAWFLPKARRDYIYNKIEPMLKLSLTADMAENEGCPYGLRVFLEMIPEAKRSYFDHPAWLLFLDEPVGSHVGAVNLIITQEELRALLRENREYLYRKQPTMWAHVSKTTRALVDLLATKKEIYFREDIVCALHAAGDLYEPEYPEIKHLINSVINLFNNKYLELQAAVKCVAEMRL